MRVMVKFSFPTEVGSELLRSGKIEKVFGQIMEDFKPEAAYFYAENGLRGGHFVVNMSESTDVLRFAERLWFGFGGSVELTPVMAPEDIQKGFGEIQGIAERYS